MARYDKYDPYTGGGRAKLAADWLPGDLDRVFGVGLNAAGLLVKGGGQTGIIGAFILTMVRKAGDVVDVMDKGEIVDFDFVGRPRVAWAPAAPGTLYYADPATGAVTATGTTGVLIGHTREKSRLMVGHGVKAGLVA